MTRKEANCKKDINENLRKLLWTNTTSRRIQNGKTEGSKIEAEIGGEIWMKNEGICNLSW